MSNGNDPALNDDGQQQPGVDPNQPNGNAPAADGGDKGPGLTFTHPQPEDPDSDDLALTELLKAAEAEEAANGVQPQPKEGDVKDPAQQNADPNAQQGQKPAGQQQQPPAGDGIMVPKARLDSVLSERDQLREKVAYLSGATEALQRVNAPGQPGQQQQPQQAQEPTHEQRLTSIKEERMKLATQFNEGQIDAIDWEEKRAVLDDLAQAIREEQLAAKLKPAPQEQAPQGDLYLAQLTEKLEKTHPWVETFSEFAEKSGSSAEWDYVANLAKDNLKQRGVALNGTAEAKYTLRKEIAVLCDQFGPALLGERAKALGITVPDIQQPPNGQQQQQQQQLSPEAKARMKALAKAADAPPDLANLNGNPGDPAGTMSDERLENLSEDEYDNLPESLRNKLLGVSG